MSVQTFEQADFTSDSASEYKNKIDNAMSIHNKTAGAFAPHEASTPNMTVVVDAGKIFSSQTLTEQSQQTSGTITAPSVDPRIDRVVIDAETGAISVITGAEAASPSAPTITYGKLPVAQILLQTSTTQIINSLITDERATFIGMAAAAAGYTRITPNFCIRNHGSSATTLVRDTTTEITAPSTKTRAYLIEISPIARSANAIAERFTSIQLSENSTMTSLHASIVARAYEHTAVVAATSLSSITTRAIVYTGVIGLSVWVRMEDDAGNQGFGDYRIVGYFD